MTIVAPRNLSESKAASSKIQDHPSSCKVDGGSKLTFVTLPFFSSTVFQARRQLRELRLALSVRRQKKNNLPITDHSNAIFDGPAGLAEISRLAEEASLAEDMAPGSRRRGGDISVVFVHAGAGYHSHLNEGVHLQACNDAAKAGMAILRSGGTAVDAVEMAIKVLEDREITNAGYGSNLAMNGTVECDATIVDHYGRSGAVGAMSQVRNPICVARLVLDESTRPLTLRRVPPNLLVGQGATDFAYELGVPLLENEYLVSSAARERWLRWREDLEKAKLRVATAGRPFDDIGETDEKESGKVASSSHVTKQGNRLASSASLALSAASSPRKTPMSDKNEYFNASPSFHSTFGSRKQDNYRDPSIELPRAVGIVSSPLSHGPGHDGHAYANSDEDDSYESESFIDDMPHFKKAKTNNKSSTDGSRGSEGSASTMDTMQLPSVFPASDAFALGHQTQDVSPVPGPTNIKCAKTSNESPHLDEHILRQLAGDDPRNQNDLIIDTVGAIAVDCYGNIAAGSSSGGIGMKHRGRTGPAALVGVGSAVIPVDPSDKRRECVAVVTSGTGEHMATTQAASVCASRLIFDRRLRKRDEPEAYTEDNAIRDFIQKDFMEHPSVRLSTADGAIGVMGVKKTRDGVFLYFGHNTDSFALASMHSDESKPVCTMSRSAGHGVIAQGGRAARYRPKH